MKKQVLALFDLKAGMYMQPFFVPTVGVAVRNLQDEMARGGEGNVLASHPEDFMLWQLAVFDDEDGSFVTDFRELGKVDTLRKE